MRHYKCACLKNLNSLIFAPKVKTRLGNIMRYYMA